MSACSRSRPAPATAPQGWISCSPATSGMDSDRPTAVRRPHGLLRRNARRSARPPTSWSPAVDRPCCCASSSPRCTSNPRPTTVSDGGARPLLRRGGCRRPASPDIRGRRLRPVGLHFVDMVAVADHSTADHMTWDITDLGLSDGPVAAGAFRAGPPCRRGRTRPAARSARPDSGRRDRLGRSSGRPADPGGGRGEARTCRQRRWSASYAVLDQYGNCSSATVLMVLERLPASARPRRGDGLRPGPDAVRRAADPPLTPDPSDRGSTTAEHVETVARWPFQPPFLRARGLRRSRTLPSARTSTSSSFSVSSSANSCRMSSR